MDPLSFGLGGQINQPGRIQRKDVAEKAASPAPADGSISFADTLSNALSEVQDLQSKADASLQKLVTAETQDIHQVMVAYEQARLSMQTMIEVRNKLVEAYQEISRMPI